MDEKLQAAVHRGRVGFTDVDYARLPFYGLYFYWFHRGYEEALRGHDLEFSDLIVDRGIGTPAVAAECRYLMPLSLGDEYEVHLRVARFDNRGWTCEFRLVRSGDAALVAEATVRNRFFDVATRRGTEVEGPVAERMAAFAAAHAEWPA